MTTRFAIIHTLKGSTELEVAFVDAPDSSVAEELLISELGGDDAVDITWIVETDNEQVAFDTYHEESNMEDPE